MPLSLERFFFKVRTTISFQDKSANNNKNLRILCRLNFNSTSLEHRLNGCYSDEATRKKIEQKKCNVKNHL